jgi:hypothetical protein
MRPEPVISPGPTRATKPKNFASVADSTISLSGQPRFVSALASEIWIYSETVCN